MRLVSQNGNVDIPYDKAILLHAQDDVMARVGDKEYLMGKYWSMEKSYRVMEMVRDAYLSRMELDGGYDMVHGCYIQPNYWVLPKVFQFPQDEDVEV